MRERPGFILEEPGVGLTPGGSARWVHPGQWVPWDRSLGGEVVAVGAGPVGQEDHVLWKRPCSLGLSCGTHTGARASGGLGLGTQGRAPGMQEAREQASVTFLRGSRCACTVLWTPSSASVTRCSLAASLASLPLSLHHPAALSFGPRVSLWSGFCPFCKGCISRVP